MSAGRDAAIDRRLSGYAARFVNECDGPATAANLTRVLASCVRPPRPGEFPRIRRHVTRWREVRAADSLALAQWETDGGAS